MRRKLTDDQWAVVRKSGGFDEACRKRVDAFLDEFDDARRNLSSAKEIRIPTQKLRRDMEYLRKRIRVVQESDGYKFANVTKGGRDQPEPHRLSQAVTALEAAEKELERALERFQGLTKLIEPKPGDELKLFFENLLELRAAVTERSPPTVRTTNTQTGPFRSLLEECARIADPKANKRQIDKAIEGAVKYFALLALNDADD